MSANDGGDPVRLSKAPVERPWIMRGTIYPLEQSPEVRAGDLITFTLGAGQFAVTYHRIEVVAMLGGVQPECFVREDDLVTWEARR